MNRRPSYASVAGGGSISSPSQRSPSTSGAFAHLMNPAPQSNTSHSYRQETGPSSTGINMAAYDSPRGGSWPAGPSTWSRDNLHNYWADSGVHGASTSGRDRFMRPSYLRRTRYMERLESQYASKLAAEQAESQHSNGKTGSLSTSSSSVSLPKITPSHRGMTYEIVEHSPVLEEDAIPPLPSQWKEYDKTGGLEVLNGNMELKCAATMKMQDHEAASARADWPMSPQCGLYYYEVAVLAKGKEGMVGIGFTGIKAELTKLPGWEPDSWAYHGDDGKSFCCQIAGKPYGDTFSVGDVVGCGVNFRDSTAFFTKNGVYQGVAFKEIKALSLFPCVGMKRGGTHIRVNFGQSPFMYDIDGHMARETSLVKDDINKSDLSILKLSLDESTLIKELVAQYLSHDGYVETAKAFAKETRAEAKALDKRVSDLDVDLEIAQDLDASNRQFIRAAILEGDIEKALKRTNAFFPRVLTDYPNIYFRLRCRKFVEMMRLCTESLNTSHSNSHSRPHGKSTNGHAQQDVFGQDMELDEPVQVADDWDRMDTEDNVGAMQRMDDTLRYGKELQLEYRDDVSKEASLNEIWALFAYDDPKNSPAAGIMDPGGRVPVAEELNSAILISLGKASSAAIERVYQQTDVLVGEITEQGAPGAFVNTNP